MDPAEAAQFVGERLPEFAPEIDEHRDTYGELLFHLLMGDLARFYMDRGRSDHELARRYWMTIERIAMEGDDFVTNALGVSLIEWFAWGNDNQKAALREAMQQFGPELRAIAASWADDLATPAQPTHKRKRQATRKSRGT